MSNDPVSPGGESFQYVFQPRVRFQHAWRTHIVLFVLTLITTTLVGAIRYWIFTRSTGADPGSLLWTLVNGFWYSGAILAILGAHEMGHYLACRYYRVDATLPYFLPLFFPVFALQTGTLGAVIRIREPFPNRKVLFDVGIAGPIAGFVVLVPLLVLGVWLSPVIEAGPNPSLLGRPLLYQLVRWLTFGDIPATHLVLLHPMAIAAWFGMLATALNLLPFGQLDGGHITYSSLGRFATVISLVTVASAVVMTYFSLSWLLMTVIMVVMLFLVGPSHPPVLDEQEPLGLGRQLLAVFALVMLILCFTPFPIPL